MEKKFLMGLFLMLGLILLLVFMFGCERQSSTRTTIIKEENEKEEAYVLPSDFVSLLEKTKTIKSIQYLYVTSKETAMNDFYVKGNNMKIKLMEPFIINATDMYDVVYIDLIEKKAKAYCEIDEECFRIKGKVYDVSFSSYYRETPLDWAKKLEKARNVVKIGSEMIENKRAIHYSLELENASGEVWIWEYNGLPLKIILNNHTYEFRNLAVNTLQDSDVVR